MSFRVVEVGRRIYGSETEVSFTVEAGARAHAVWYRVRGAPAAPAHDAALCATLIPAMGQGGGLALAHPVSPRLLAQAERIQALLAGWYPALRRVRVEAVGAAEARPRAAGVACMFSAGVDSFYSALTHRQRLTHLITMHGHDIAYDDQARYARIIAPIREAAAALGLALIEVRTNLRTFADRYAGWAEQYFGAAMASVAQLLAPAVGRVIIPPSFTMAQARPWGSHPDLDPLWSTEAVEIVHEPCDADRTQRLRLVVGSPLARRALRVCLRDRGDGYNCCRCEKCLRTMIALRALGVLEQCAGFPEPLDPARVARIDASSPSIRTYLEENLRHVRASGRDPALVRALRDALEGVYARGAAGWPRRAARLAGRWLRGGRVDRFGNPVARDRAR